MNFAKTCLLTPGKKDFCHEDDLYCSDTKYKHNVVTSNNNRADVTPGQPLSHTLQSKQECQN